MIKEEPLVSIILVNYNGMKDTIECIDSIMNIDYKNYEIVLVDNGSTLCEEFPEVYQKNKRIHYLQSEDNLGFAGGCNLGCRYATEILRTDYLLLLNNDTVVSRDFLSRMMECNHRCGSETIVTGKIYYETDRSKLWYAGGRVDYSRGLAVHFTDDKWYGDKKYPKVTFASGCLILFPSKAFDDVNGLPEEYFLYYEDVDFCCTLQKKEYILRLCPEAVIYHKVNASTGTKSDLSVYYGSRNRLYFVRKFVKKKWRGYISAYTMCFRRILRHPFRSKVVWQAMADFEMGIVGKK